MTITKTLLWRRLKNMRCPSCGEAIIKCSNGTQMGYGCSSKGYVCTFFVGEKRFGEIIADMYKPKENEDYQDNIKELNNL